MTSSPAAKPLTPDPVWATTPARSLPCPDGNVAGHLACIRPARILASPGLIPVALTWTSTCPGPGAGVGTSTTFRTSTSPYSSKRTAFTGAPPFLQVPLNFAAPLRMPGVLLERRRPQRAGVVIDLGIGGRRGPVGDDELIDQAAGPPSPAGPGPGGGGGARVGPRPLVRRVR